MSESIQIATAAAVATSPQSGSAASGQAAAAVSVDDPSGFNAMFESYVAAEPVTTEQQMNQDMSGLFSTKLPQELIAAGNPLPQEDTAASWQAFMQIQPDETVLSGTASLKSESLLEQQAKPLQASTANSSLLNQQLSQDLAMQNKGATTPLGVSTATHVGVSTATHVASPQLNTVQLNPESAEALAINMDEIAPISQLPTSTTNQSLAAVGLGTAVQAATSQAQAAPLNLGQTAWESNLGSRLQMLVGQNVQAAEIRLDPPELGTLDIKIKVTNDVATVNITSPHSQVREALETAVPKLREMFEESGLSLGDVNVQQESFKQQEQLAEHDVFDVFENAEDTLLEEKDGLTSNTIISDSLLDIYA